jgi:flavodoxin
MRILIVYDTTSANRNTEKVAKTIESVLRQEECSVDCHYVADADPTNVGNYDCLLIGSPTEGFRPKKLIKEFLDSLPKGEFSGKPAAAFDTQVQSRFSGSAAKKIQSKLEQLGFRIAAEPLAAYVEGKQAEIHLKDGEMEKTANWAQELTKSLSK